MKRALFDTVTVLPFASGNVVDRTGYESAVLAVTVEASQTATIKVETADSTAGPYEPIKDSRIFVDNPVNEDGEAVIENEAEAQAVANLDIDLIGCKSCVKITATNGTIGALALGDATNCPVKYLMEGCMMARMFKPPKSAPRPAENKAVHAKERKTAATPPAASQEAPEKGAQ
jgi:hypothetical protein